MQVPMHFQSSSNKLTPANMPHLIYFTYDKIKTDRWKNMSKITQTFSGRTDS